MALPTNVSLCNAALEQYNLAFSIGSVSVIIGSFIFGFVQNSWGIFATRTICGLLTTCGLICFYMYRTSAYYIHAAKVLGLF